MALAAFWGKSVGYFGYGCSVMIETIDGRMASVSKDAFDYLYYKLDDFTAALKEDCIEYTIHRRDRPLLSYPQWYINAFRDGWIVRDEYGYGDYTFYDVEQGEIPMSPVCILLRNRRGELRYMEPSQFNKYYDALGE